MAEARELFLVGGFSDVSMQQIADASGVTKAALYYHFRSKEDLFADVVRRLVNEFWQGLIACTEAEGSLREILLKTTEFSEVMAIGRIRLLLLNDVERYLVPEVVTDIFTTHPTPDASFDALFRRAIDRGEMREVDVALTSRLYSAMLIGLFHRGHEHVRPNPGDAERLVDLFLHGVAR